MQIQATQKYIHIAPRKLRLVVDAVKSLPPQTAINHLDAINNRASQALSKVILQAMANAANNHNLNTDTLKFHTLKVDQAFIMKRWQAVSRGRPHSIQKKTSHLTVVLTPLSSTQTDSVPAPRTSPAPISTPASKSSPQTTATKKSTSKPSSKPKKSTTKAT